MKAPLEKNPECIINKFRGIHFNLKDHLRYLPNEIFTLQKYDTLFCILISKLMKKK